MNPTEVNPLLTLFITVVIMILALVGIGDFEFGPFTQELLDLT